MEDDGQVDSCNLSAPLKVDTSSLIYSFCIGKAAFARIGGYPAVAGQSHVEFKGGFLFFPFEFFSQFCNEIKPIKRGWHAWDSVPVFTSVYLNLFLLFQ